MFKVYRATGEIARNPSSHNNLTISRYRADRFDRVMVLFVFRLSPDSRLDSAC